MSVTEREYLGDGVYAEFDGWQVWLSLDSGARAGARIALEPDVLRRVVEYAARRGVNVAPAGRTA